MGSEMCIRDSLTDLALCVNRYRLFSPGWYVCVLTKVKLSSEESEVPGLVAMVNYGRKKQCDAGDDAFYGPPNFVLDVFDSKDDPDESVALLGPGPHRTFGAFENQDAGRGAGRRRCRLGDRGGVGGSGGRCSRSGRWTIRGRCARLAPRRGSGNSPRR